MIYINHIPLYLPLSACCILFCFGKIFLPAAYSVNFWYNITETQNANDGVKDMFFITFSRQAGSLGYEIIQMLSKRLGIEVITHDFIMNNWLPEIAGDHELRMLSESPRFFLKRSGTGVSFAEYIETRLREVVTKQSVIIQGLGSQVIFAGDPAALHVRITASDAVRLSRVMQTHGLEKQDAIRFLELSDRKRRRFINTVYEKDWADPGLYHLTLNTDYLGVRECVSLLAYLAEVKMTAAVCPGSPDSTEETGKPSSFRHPSEEEFSKILDMYNIAWEYEPRTFPIEWDAEGNITKAFAPDFYLPRFDTYIELTTMDQKYVTEKKKKMRLLKELYPGTNINIVFKNDFYSLLKRFGLREGEPAPREGCTAQEGKGNTLHKGGTKGE